MHVHLGDTPTPVGFIPGPPPCPSGYFPTKVMSGDTVTEGCAPSTPLPDVTLHPAVEPLVCTQEQKVCPDGTPAIRNADCSWQPCLASSDFPKATAPGPVTGQAQPIWLYLLAGGVVLFLLMKGGS